MVAKPKRRRVFKGKRPPIEPDDSAQWIDAPQLRRRYGGRSDMWIVRLLKSDPKFPKPIVVNRLRFWRISEIVAWERLRAADRHEARKIHHTREGAAANT